MGLRKLHKLQRRRHNLDARELDLITAARSDGATWAAIANAIGLTSAEGAKQRYGRLVRQVRQPEKAIYVTVTGQAFTGRSLADEIQAIILRRHGRDDPPAAALAR